MIQVDKRVFANVRGEPMAVHMAPDGIRPGIMASGTALQERLRELSIAGKRVLILELAEPAVCAQTDVASGFVAR